MQLSYNVIKKECISSEAICTINMPLVQLCTVNEDTETVDEDTLIENAIQHAEDIVNDAQLKSSELMSSALNEAEKIKKEAYELAFKKGYSEGAKQGRVVGLSQTDEIRKNAGEVLKEAHRASREYIENQKDEIIKLAFSIAEKVIDHKVDVNDSIIVSIAGKAIENAVSKGQAVIRVNPMDYAVLDCRVDELMRLTGESILVNIIKDNEIKRGGCIVDTGLSSVDATIDSQLEKIREALLG